jgi:hypothetical protein
MCTVERIVIGQSRFSLEPGLTLRTLYGAAVLSYLRCTTSTRRWIPFQDPKDSVNDKGHIHAHICSRVETVIFTANLLLFDSAALIHLYSPYITPIRIESKSCRNASRGKKVTWP